jgi:hypothetical protein
VVVDCDCVAAHDGGVLWWCQAFERCVIALVEEQWHDSNGDNPVHLLLTAVIEGMVSNERAVATCTKLRVLHQAHKAARPNHLNEANSQCPRF